ncbi:Mpo1-like protein [Paraglaciecola aestuariivivens]
MSSESKQQFNNFAEFYPYYLAEHQNLICRRLHFIGSALIIALIIYTLFTSQWQLLWFIPVLGYGFAWAGHAFFEHNKPATFRYPLYSLLGDWVMFKDILVGNIKR